MSKPLRVFAVKVYRGSVCNIDSIWLLEEHGRDRKRELGPDGVYIEEVELGGTVAESEAAELIRGLLSVFESEIYRGAMTMANVHGFNIDPEDEEYKINVAAVRAAKAWLKERNDAPPPTTT